MKMKFLLPMLLVAAVACDDSTGPTGDPLTAAEARALAAAVAGASSGGVNLDTADNASLALLPGDGPALDRFEHSAAIDVEVPCSEGGTAAIDGSLDLVIDDDDPDNAFITYDAAATQSHAACAFVTDEDVQITLDGDVDLLIDFDIVNNASTEQAQLDLVYELGGTLDFVTSDGREGSCPIDVTQLFHAEAGEATHTIEGRVCGQTVQLNSNWTGGQDT